MQMKEPTQEEVMQAVIEEVRYRIDAERAVEHRMLGIIERLISLHETCLMQPAEYIIDENTEHSN